MKNTFAELVSISTKIKVLKDFEMVSLNGGLIQSLGNNYSDSTNTTCTNQNCPNSTNCGCKNDCCIGSSNDVCS